MVLDDRLQRVVGDVQALRRETVVFDLLGEQVVLGDVQLLPARVARDADDLHAVAERRGDGVADVRGRDEHHLREVVGDLEVVVAEGVVLLGVEDLEERRRRIAAEVVADLVDLIEHEDRVDGPGLLHALDDLAGEGADVGAAVTADGGLVVHAAKADAMELASEGARHAAAE